MTMQNNIDIVRRIFRRNVHQPKLQPFSLKIDNQRPVFIPIAVTANNRERRTDHFQIVGDRRVANIAQMPDLIRACRHLENCAWQFVVRISENKYFHSASAWKAPTTKSQEPGKSQAPMSKQQPLRLNIGIWNFLGG